MERQEWFIWRSLGCSERWAPERCVFAASQPAFGKHWLSGSNLVFSVLIFNLLEGGLLCLLWHILVSWSGWIRIVTSYLVVLQHYLQTISLPLGRFDCLMISFPLAEAVKDGMIFFLDSSLLQTMKGSWRWFPTSVCVKASPVGMGIGAKASAALLPWALTMGLRFTRRAASRSMSKGKWRAKLLHPPTRPWSAARDTCATWTSLPSCPPPKVRASFTSGASGEGAGAALSAVLGEGWPQCWLQEGFWDFLHINFFFSLFSHFFPSPVSPKGKPFKERLQGTAWKH